MAGTVLSWSGGKDASVALRELRADGVEIEALLTTVSAETGRSTMHGVRRELYDRQAAALGENLRIVELPPEPDNDTYESVMADVVAEYEVQGIERMAFADLYLEDVREYREGRLADAELAPVFPIWGRSTDDVAETIVDAGFEATVVAVDGEALDESFVGRRYDREFLADLPASVDPCGEEGSFHTFVHGGPIFEEPVPIERGETATKPVADGEFHYCDLRANGD